MRVCPRRPPESAKPRCIDPTPVHHTYCALPHDHRTKGGGLLLGKRQVGRQTQWQTLRGRELITYCPRVSSLCPTNGSVSGNATADKNGRQFREDVGPRDRRGRFAHWGCFQRGLSTMLTTFQIPMARNDDNTSTIPRRLHRQRAAQDPSG